MPEGYCNDCRENKGVTNEGIYCSSPRHAKFMDTHGRNWWWRMHKAAGMILIKATGAGAISIPCPDHKDVA